MNMSGTQPAANRSCDQCDQAAEENDPHRRRGITRSRVGGRRTRRWAEVSVAAGGDACAVRTPNAAVWALAAAAGSAKTPAKATHIAAVLIPIMTPT